MTDLILSTSGLSTPQIAQLTVKLSEALKLPVGKLPGITRPHLDFEGNIRGLDYIMPDEARKLRDKAEEILDEFMVLTESNEGQE